MDGFFQISLDDMLEQFRDDRYVVNNIISDFSCPLNRDVEYYLKHTASVFAEQGIAKTFLVFTSYKDKPVLVGYYTICMKSIQIQKDKLSANLRKRLKKFAAIKPETGDYYILSPLIAQLGKNYSNEYNKLIKGDELLLMAIERVKDVQRLVGGKTVYLECEDTPKLIEFYTSNGFVSFNKRILERDETEVMKGEYLIQMLKYLH